MRFISIRIVAGFLVGAWSALLGSGCAAPSSASAGSPSAGATKRGPVVVFEAGAGEGADTWSRVAPEIATIAPVFAYTRGTLRDDTGGNSGSDGAAVVHRLRARLAKLGHRPPYVLVGHSLGGLYMQLFAKLHPDEVAGVVLVDSTTVDHRERMRTEQPAAFRAVQVLTTLQAMTPLGAELRSMEKTAAQWHAAGPFPACPAIVLTATEPGAVGGRGFVQFTLALQSELIAQWPGAQQRVVATGHYIHREAPDKVNEAIRDVLARVRAGSPP